MISSPVCDLVTELQTSEIPEGFMKHSVFVSSLGRNWFFHLQGRRIRERKLQSQRRVGRIRSCLQVNGRRRPLRGFIVFEEKDICTFLSCRGVLFYSEDGNSWFYETLSNSKNIWQHSCKIAIILVFCIIIYWETFILLLVQILWFSVLIRKEFISFYYNFRLSIAYTIFMFRGQVILSLTYEFVSFLFSSTLLLIFKTVVCFRNVVFVWSVTMAEIQIHISDIL
jgi:hypothetical protein